MGVGASMSVSIVINGRLWGLIACHHMAPKRVPYSIRMAADVLAQVIASTVQSIEAREDAELVERAARCAPAWSNRCCWTTTRSKRWSSMPTACRKPPARRRWSAASTAASCAAAIDQATAKPSSRRCRRRPRPASRDARRLAGGAATPARQVGRHAGPALRPARRAAGACCCAPNRSSRWPGRHAGQEPARPAGRAPDPARLLRRLARNRARTRPPVGRRRSSRMRA
jgi:hypothetical protein